MITNVMPSAEDVEQVVLGEECIGQEREDRADEHQSDDRLRLRQQSEDLLPALDTGQARASPLRLDRCGGFRMHVP
jgi:hypothetical protein